MDLSTKYLGIDLHNPFVVGASPLTAEMDTIRELEDAGASALVLPSLFEEQISKERQLGVTAVEAHSESFGEALTYLPEPPEMRLGPDHYLEHLKKAKEAVAIPVIASLNGVTDSGWVDYAKTLESAGADALELNVYRVATDMDEDSTTIETNLVNIAKRVSGAVNIPVAVKLSASYSAMANVCKKVTTEGGAKGVVLFNRFFQPDIDIKEIEISPKLNLSTSSELALRLAWTGILAGRLDASIAVTGGVHTVEDAIKAIMSGADAIQIVSALLKDGTLKLSDIIKGVDAFLTENEYTSLSQMKGNMSLKRCPDPQSYERVNYMRLLKGWRTDMA